MSEPLQVEVNDVEKLLSFLFYEYIKDNPVPQADWPVHPKTGNPIPFIKWLAEHNDKLRLENPSIVADHKPETVEFVFTLPERAYGGNQIQGLWSRILLAHRPHLHAVESVNVQVIIKFTDGVVVPLSAFAHKEVVDMDMRDAEVVHLVQSYAPQLAQTIAKTGLDTMHDKNKGEFTFATPAVLANLEHAVGKAIHAGDISQADGADLARLVYFIKNLFPAEIPEYLKPHQKRNKAPAPHVKTAPAGWSLPGHKT